MEVKNSPSFRMTRHWLCYKEDEPHTITENSIHDMVGLCQKWEQSNCLCVMFIKTMISSDTHGWVGVEENNNVKNLLKVIDVCNFKQRSS